MFEAHRRKHHHGSNRCWRLSFEKGHSVFQIELAIDELDPVVIPGPVGTPPRETTDPVEILNSVVVEGWKFVDGEFVHVELRNGLIGCYLSALLQAVAGDGRHLAGPIGISPGSV